MSAVDMAIEEANGTATLNGAPSAAELLLSEDAAIAAFNRANPTTTEIRTIGLYTVKATYNGNAVPADVKRNAVTGTAGDWDKMIARMLECKRGAESLIPAVIRFTADGVPQPRYATTQIQKAMLRLAPHHYGRVKLERLDGSHDEKTGGVTFGALLLTVKPANR